MVSGQNRIVVARRRIRHLPLSCRFIIASSLVIADWAECAGNINISTLRRRGRPARGHHYGDMRCQTRTRVVPGANATAFAATRDTLLPGRKHHRVQLASDCGGALGARAKTDYAEAKNSDAYE